MSFNVWILKYITFTEWRITPLRKKIKSKNLEVNGWNSKKSSKVRWSRPRETNRNSLMWMLAVKSLVLIYWWNVLPEYLCQLDRSFHLLSKGNLFLRQAFHGRGIPPTPAWILALTSFKDKLHWPGNMRKINLFPPKLWCGFCNSPTMNLERANPTQHGFCTCSGTQLWKPSYSALNSRRQRQGSE